MVGDSPQVKCFFSYSWSSPTHQTWVINLAKRLVEDGVDVALDKWDLKPGHDSYAFMESMITDPLVTKVLLVCDQTYTEKANDRSGGVGAESQIISPELYKRREQDKFAALITEVNDEGEAYVPIFYKGRIYFDFSSNGNFESGYEELLRWLLDKPQFIKPQLGKPPEALSSERAIAFATTSRFRRAEEALRTGSSAAPGLLREFRQVALEEFRNLAPIEPESKDIGDSVISSVANMRPLARQIVQLGSVVARFSDGGRAWEQILATLESLASLMFRQASDKYWNPLAVDAYSISAHDVFLSLVATALREERFDLATQALERGYYVKGERGSAGGATSNFDVFRQYPRSLERKQKELNRVSYHADLVHEAHKDGGEPSFADLLQADFVLFLRSTLGNHYDLWYPITLIYLNDRHYPFEIFARGESKAYLERLRPVLGASSLDELKMQISEANKMDVTRRLLNHYGLPVSSLANLEHLGTRK